MCVVGRVTEWNLCKIKLYNITGLAVIQFIQGILQSDSK
jgi:hypothetical protein